MRADKGGPAFPHEYFDKQLNQGRVMHGMTLRDYFAAKAMHAILSNPEFGGEDTDIAGSAYWAADAMLKARQA
jgi:hypothetical protein